MDQKRNDRQKEPLIVGIAGGSASGKSTFVRVLYQTIPQVYPHLQVQVFRSDRYFRVNSPEMPRYYSPSFGQDMPDYNHPDSLNITRMIADMDAMAVGDGGIDVILVEGHLLLHYPEVRERLGLSVYLELDADTRALRRLVRNLDQKGDPLPDHGARSIANYYLESAKLGHARYIEPSKQHADLILRGDGDFGRSAFHLAAVIHAEWLKRSE